MNQIDIGRGKVAIVDKEDFKRVSRHIWYYEKNSHQEYAKIKTSYYTIRMHNFIMGKRKGFVIDHIDQNGLNNRRCNLRFINRSMNALNSTKAKRYYYDKYHKKFIARMYINGKKHKIGNFVREQDAIKAVAEFTSKMIS